MESDSRIAKTQFNFAASFLNNIVVTLLGFATRTVFIHSLGLDYLGLNGLFSNVLTILSLAELGVGSAITFSLYKPIAENNTAKITALMALYKRAYQIIGCVVLVLGLALTPFLQYIVNLDTGMEINYLAIYFMFLFNTVVSYWFFAYRSVIIYAHQEGYVLTKIETIFALIRAAVQFAVLFIFRNYYVYLAIPITCGIIKNVIIARVAAKRYPYVKDPVTEPLSKTERKGIFKNIAALSTFKISSVVYGATDNVIISGWLGTAMVGLVSNFTMVIGIVTTYVNMVFQSMYASVGNLYASESKEYTYLVYKRLDVLNYWIYTYCAICLGCFLNPLIRVWLGTRFCLEPSTVILLAAVFYVPGLNNIINIYKDACGLFKEVQWRALATAIINLGVSILLVTQMGINGVYVGTLVAYFTTIYVVDPQVVFKKVFERSPREYYGRLILKMLLAAALFAACWIAVSLINIQSWLWMILVFLGLTVVVNALFFAIYRKKEEFAYLLQIARKTAERILKRLKRTKIDG